MPKPTAPTWPGRPPSQTAASPLSRIDTDGVAALYAPGARWRYEGVHALEEFTEIDEPGAGGAAAPFLCFAVQFSSGEGEDGALHPVVSDQRPPLPGVMSSEGPGAVYSPSIYLQPESAADTLARAIIAGATLYAPTFTSADGQLQVLERLLEDLLPHIRAAEKAAARILAEASLLPAAIDETLERFAQSVARFDATGWTGPLPAKLEELWLAVPEQEPRPEPPYLLADLTPEEIEDFSRASRHSGTSAWHLYRIADYASPYPLRLRTVSPQETPSPGAPSPSATELLIAPSSGHYYSLQHALALKRFGPLQGSRFPRTFLQRGGVHGYAELRPHPPNEDAFKDPDELQAIERNMWQHSDELDDRDADTLDAIMTTWLRSASSPNDKVPVFLDDLLRLRHLKAKMGGQGRRGGYAQKQREALWRCLLHLQDIWIDIAAAPVPDKTGSRVVQSKALVLTDRVGQRRLDGYMQVEAILVTPGEAFGRFLFGPGRQAALLSANAIRYHPVRQSIEKRLTRLFSWHWRAGAKSADFVRVYRVRTLTEEVGLEEKPTKPARQRDRFEKALDRLEKDGVIAGWQYREDFSEESLPAKGWYRFWLEARLLIEAPEAIRTAYRSLDRGPKPRPLAAKTDLAEHLRQRRANLGLTQIQAAEEIGISRSSLKRFERGAVPSRRDLKARINRWLERQDREVQDP